MVETQLFAEYRVFLRFILVVLLCGMQFDHNESVDNGICIRVSVSNIPE